MFADQLCPTGLLAFWLFSSSSSTVSVIWMERRSPVDDNTLAAGCADEDEVWFRSGWRSRSALTSLSWASEVAAIDSFRMSDSVSWSLSSSLVMPRSSAMLSSKLDMKAAEKDKSRNGGIMIARGAKYGKDWMSWMMQLWCSGALRIHQRRSPLRCGNFHWQCSLRILSLVVVPTRWERAFS